MATFLYNCCVYRAWPPYAVTKLFCNFDFLSVEWFFPRRDFHGILTIYYYISLKRRGLSKKFIFNPCARSLGGQGGLRQQTKHAKSSRARAVLQKLFSQRCVIFKLSRASGTKQLGPKWLHSCTTTVFTELRIPVWFSRCPGPRTQNSWGQNGYSLV